MLGALLQKNQNVKEERDKPSIVSTGGEVKRTTSHEKSAGRGTETMLFTPRGNLQQIRLGSSLYLKEAVWRNTKKYKSKCLAKK